MQRIAPRQKDKIESAICICSTCICYSHGSCSKSSAPHSAFASARLMALRRLVAGRALDFRNVSQGLPYQRHVLFVNHGHHIMKYVLLALPHQLQWYPPQLVSNTRVGGCWQGSLKCRGQSSASCQRTSSLIFRSARNSCVNSAYTVEPLCTEWAC